MGKNGIEYFSLACIFEDKMELLEAEYGLKGFAVIIKVYQRIYGENGYYCDWNDEVALLFSRKYLNGELGGNAVSEVINTAIKRGIFDDDKYKEYGILTSAGIQKRYFEAVKRRKKVEVDKQYLLLNDSILPENVYINEKNVNRNEENACRNRQRKGKESKGEERKVNTGDAALDAALDDFIDFRKKIKAPLTDRALNLIAKKLSELTSDNNKKIAILEQSIMRGWKGVFPLEEDKGTKKGKFYSEMEEWANERNGVCNSSFGD